MLSTMERSSINSLPRTSRSANDLSISAVVFPTALDWVAVAWQDELLHGVAFGYASQRQARIGLARSLYRPGQFWRFPAQGQLVEEPSWLQNLVDDLQRFADGEPVDFRNVPISEAHLSRFGRRVTAACRAICWGQVTTYGALAAKCGSPAAARAVGSVMAKNRFPLVVPCHRVLGAGGALGGYSAPDGLKMKRRLLAMEGRTSVV
jgi:methylated-DNA-[protein]-cysteine S-methyltransferase